ncbi:hypothetical protein Tco_0477981 [Tanacetum coccineum]
MDKSLKCVRVQDQAGQNDGKHGIDEKSIAVKKPEVSEIKESHLPLRSGLAGIRIRDNLRAGEWKWKEYSSSCDVEVSFIKNQGDFSEYNDLRDCGG